MLSGAIHVGFRLLKLGEWFLHSGVLFALRKAGFSSLSSLTFKLFCGARELLSAVSDCLKPVDRRSFLLLFNSEMSFNTLLLRQMFAETITPSCSHCLLPSHPDNITTFFHLWESQWLVWGVFLFDQREWIENLHCFSEREGQCPPGASRLPEVLHGVWEPLVALLSVMLLHSLVQSYLGTDNRVLCAARSSHCWVL